uniref:Immunoglobulin subtype domain-containing protein n=1 Tax=Oncorhynchus tshawytscha TaxID=74940 RepID=A0AAZ3Q981_ONCTS
NLYNIGGKPERKMRNLMSVNISLLCAVICVMSAVITKRGTEGGNDTIQCPYDRGFKTHQKYLSKGIWANRVDVIKTQTHQHPARRVFTVTITNLVLDDSGTYWCEINTWWWYHKTEVRITVDRGWCLRRSISVVLGVVMFSGGVLGVVLLLLGLLLFMFFRQRRDRDRRPTASKHSASLLMPDSMTTNQDPDTGTITNPIYATATNQNPDSACDITTIYTNTTNPRRDDIHFNVVQSSVHHYHYIIILFVCQSLHSARPFIHSLFLL